MEKLNIKELLEIISSQSKTQKVQAAFNEIYSRISLKFMTFCKTLCYRHPFKQADVWTKDIFQEAFTKFLTGSKKLKISDKDSESEQEQKLLRWLQGIARNELKSVLRKQVAKLYESDVEKIPDKDCEDEKTNSITEEKLDLIRKTIGRLTEREMDVLRTYFYYKPNYIERSALEALALKYRTTTKNISKIKERALKKLTKMVLDNDDDTK